MLLDYFSIYAVAGLVLLTLANVSYAQTGDYTLVGSKFSDKVNNNVNISFSSPADIITDYTNGLMYVADKFNNRIVYCYLNSTDNCRQYTITWSTLGSSCTVYSCLTSGATCCSYPAYLKDPTGVAVDTLGNLWIADRINNRLVYCSGLLSGNCQLFAKKVSLTGAPTGAPAGSPTSAPTAFSNPYSIVLGSSSSGSVILYVSDLYNDRIVACEGLTNLKIEGYTDCTVYAQYYTHNSESTTFNEARGLALDGNYLYISDTLNSRLVVCTGIDLYATSCQTYASAYGGGTGAAFGRTYGTARSLGYLYFADWTNNVVGYCIGDTTGACYTYTDTAAGTALVRPSGIGITQVTYEIFISDATNQRIVYIKAFTPAPTLAPTVEATAIPTSPTYSPTSYGVTYLGSGDCRISSSVEGVDFSSTINYTVTQPTLSSCLQVCANTPNCNAIMYTESCNCCHPVNQCYLYTGGTYTATNGVSCLPCYSVTALTPESTGVPTVVPLDVPSYKPTESKPMSVVSKETFSPSTAHVITFQLYTIISNWPFNYVTNASIDAIASLVSDITATDDVQVTYSNIKAQSNQRRLLSYILPLIIEITAMSTFQSTINKNFINSMNTVALISALNNECGCTIYSDISIIYMSADGYCVNATTPSSQCSFGHIKLNPYLTSIADSAFSNTLVTGVDFGECALLTEIGIGAFENTYVESLDMLSCCNLVSIDDHAFAGSQITKVKLPQNLQERKMKDVFRDNPLQEVYCAAPYDDVLRLTGIVHTFHGLVIGCFGYTSDYFLYPGFSVTPRLTPVIIIMVVLFVVSHSAICLLSYNHYSLTFLLVSVLASLDLGSDIIHFLFGIYSTRQLYAVSFVFVLLLPVLYFVLTVLVQHSIVPHVLYKSYFGRIMSRRYKWTILWIWLSAERGVPLVNRKRHKFVFNNHDSIPKVMVFISSWVILLTLQILTLIPFFIWVVVLSPYYIALILVGSFLFHTKLLGHKDVWNCWVLLFTGRFRRYSKTSIYDTKLLNDAMFTQLILTSLPLLLIKIINYMQNNERHVFDTISIDGVDMGHVVFNYNAYVSIFWPIVSLVFSALYCAIGIYRYFYLVLRYNYLIQEVPFTVELCFHDVRRPVGISKTEEDIKYNKEAVIPYRKYWKKQVYHAEIESAMNSVINVANQFFIKDMTLSESLDVLLQSRVDLVQSALDFVDLHTYNEVACEIDAQQLASKVLVLLLKDSVDLTMYRLLKREGIRESADLLDVDQRTIKAILSALNNRAIQGTVLAYLNLITYNNFTARSGSKVAIDAGANAVNVSLDDAKAQRESNDDVESSLELGNSSRKYESLDAQSDEVT